MLDRFRFKANAVAAAGHITVPFNKVIEVQAGSTLPAIGGYGSARVHYFRYRDILRFRLAHTEVSGSRIEHPDKSVSFVTGIKATVEELNILEMVTADRVVANIVSTYQDDPDGEPAVALIGTRFENLRIAGIPVKVDLATDLLDRMPRHRNLREAWGDENLRRLFGDSTLKERLKDAPANVSRWFSHVVGNTETGTGSQMPERRGIARMSLVRNLQPESNGLHCFGHVIHVEGFGTIRLAEVEITRLTRAVTMIEIDLGCPYQGTLMCCSADDGGSPWDK